VEASHRGLLSPRRSPGWYAREWTTNVVQNPALAW